MQVPKPRKLKSGSWFIQLRLNSESIPVTEPTKEQCIATARLIKAEYLAGKRQQNIVEERTLRQILDHYIDSRTNTLSPSTIKGYKKIRDERFKDFVEKRVADIKNWQAMCNAEAKICSPKTLKNAWFLVASALRFSKIQVPDVTLPQVPVKERPYLDPDQIPVFIKAVKGQSCEISALLGLHSLRRSEICALTWDNIDLGNRRILVSGAAVQNDKNEVIIKEVNKNTASHRYVPIMMDELYNALNCVENKTGFVVNNAPHVIYDQINRICARNGLPKIGVHGLRHSFASLAYHLGVPEKIAMGIGGWADYNTMRKIYTHLAQKDIVKYEEDMTNFFKNANRNANGNQ